MEEYEEKTILTIDASEETQQGVQTALPDRPCKFVFVDAAADGVMSLMVEAPHLVVVSLEMPDGDGVAMLQNIRAMSPDIPLVVLIGEPTKDKIVAAKKAKPIDILLKPPDWERLATKIKNALWIDLELLRPAEEGKEGEGEEGEEAEAPPPEPEEPAPFVEAIPKGAEVANINDTIAGMKIARTLVLNDVVYGDKGQLLTKDMIKQLNRIGVSEVCVYTDLTLKKQVAQRKKRAMQQQSMVAEEKTTDRDGGKVFSKVKRQTIRVAVDVRGICKAMDENGQHMESECNIVDISAGGCALLTKDRLKKNQEIKLSFDLEGMLMKDVRGVVRHCMARNAKPPEFPIRSGIFFDGITERDKEKLFTKIFQIERDNKRKEDELRARYGYGPKRRRKY